MTLCLNMMVKNEEHCILHTLTILTSRIKFDYWVISDTGSTDNTASLILAFFAAAKIKGELIDDVWRNYSENRTTSLNHAYNKTDYVIVFHPDDIIETRFSLPEPLLNDAYYLKLRDNSKEYQYCLVLNNRLHWSFRATLDSYSYTDERVDSSSRSLQNRVESIVSLTKT